MTASSFIRGGALLLVAPIVTICYSLAILIAIFLFRLPEDKLQRYPRQWARWFCRLAGVRVIIEGADKLQSQAGYIYCANHLSQFDIFSFQGYFPLSFRWLAKEELFKVPFLGRAMTNSGAISINRSHGREALKSLQQAAERIKTGTSILIFPEGTRSIDGTLQPFKGGAMLLAVKAGVPIVPVAFIGSYSVLPKGAFLTRPGTITIRIGDPVVVTGYSNKNKQDLAIVIHDKIAELLAQSH
ncbi:MAG: 1-acyl-sn-glycerol-3-phosphate acyltransferase [Proteobacteria bacterium]|nr:1-acyl-sn-glycerol-3-phosphate acyltransferase [Pseudomonadota bacterium]MBU1650310.1 1-acyl-sn-glycerol-3-phosphate acyltransferase [Pseudomonadota bacterium]MBU1986297.1 1-acyl-sn-glycerol-3-phosphate acyltransferase [Pseudomonadota bacterium]